MLVLFLKLCCAEPDLPFDDEQSYTGTTYSFDSQAADQPTNTPHSTPQYQIQSIKSVIRTPEILAISILCFYVSWYIIGSRSANAICKHAQDTIQQSLKKYFAAVPTRFVRSELHRFDAFSTGRKCYKGVLTCIRVSRRCDPVGWFWDLVLGHKSMVAFEFLCENPQKMNLIFQVSGSKPAFGDYFHLEEYPVSEERLKCYTDLLDTKNAFLPSINLFLEAHPKVVKFIEISDANRFDLGRECRNVVRIELEFTDSNRDIVFSDEVVEWAVNLADKFCSTVFSEDTVKRAQQQRLEILGTAKAKND